MSVPARRPISSLLALLFALAPVAFSLVAALSRRHDLRMGAMAVAGLAGALGAARWGGGRGAVQRGARALGLGTVLAGALGYVLGARAAAGIWPVALVLTGCWVAAITLATGEREPR